MSQIVSLLVCILVGFAYFNRKNLRRHVTAMSLAFVLDLSLVLYLQLARSAVNTAMTQNDTLLRFHVCVSVFSLLLYVLQFYLGRRYRSGHTAALNVHRLSGRLFLICRLASFVSSLFIESYVLKG